MTAYFFEPIAPISKVQRVWLTCQQTGTIVPKNQVIWGDFTNAHFRIAKAKHLFYN